MPARSYSIRIPLLSMALALLCVFLAALKLTPRQDFTVSLPALPAPTLNSAPGRTVRVAAIQCPSQMGRLRENRVRLTELITQAAKRGAKIVVLPECAVHGYFDPLEDLKWTRSTEPDAHELPASDVAEHVPGTSTRYFGDLARTLGIYLTVPLVESDRGVYFNSVVLMGPDGKIAARHRKSDLWNEGDSSWATAGVGDAQVASTPYGRLGLMICHDYQTLPKQLRGKADIVLYSVGWYGPNTEGWYSDMFPRQVVVPNGFAVIAANWAAAASDDLWQGVGYSTIYKADGTVVAMSSRTSGNDIVYGDLPIPVRPVSPPVAIDDE